MIQEEETAAQVGTSNVRLAARRRLVKGAFSVPAALTIVSTGSSAVSATCVKRAVVNQAQPVTPVTVPLYTLSLTLRLLVPNGSGGFDLGSSVTQTFSVVQGSDVDGVKFTGVTSPLGTLLTGLTGAALYVYATGASTPVVSFAYTVGQVLSALPVGYVTYTSAPPATDITIGSDQYQVTVSSLTPTGTTLNAAYAASGTLEGFFATGTNSGSINSQDVNAISTGCFSSFFPGTP